jgi:hypothetical protein
MLVKKLKSKKLNGDLIAVQLLLNSSIGFCCFPLNNLVVTCLGIFLWGEKHGKESVDVRGMICPCHYFKTKKFLLYSTLKFKSLIHVFFVVAYHLYMMHNGLGFYMLQNVLTNNKTFIFWIHVMICHDYCYGVKCCKCWKEHGQWT